MSEHKMNDTSRLVIQTLVDFSGGADEVDHVWLIDEHEPGSVLTPEPTVADEANRIYYVDLYSRGKLMLYVPATGLYSEAVAHRYLALDSNMFNGFKRYVLDDERDTQFVVGMEQLIEYAIVHRYSVLPNPYLFEIIFSRGFEAAAPYCEQIVEAVLRLEYMDGGIFRACREFSFSDVALDSLEKRFGTRSFQLAAKKRTAELLHSRIDIRAHYYMSYLAVLALVATGLEFEDRNMRISSFDDLLLKRVGGRFPGYMLLARLYYCDKISRWIASAPGSRNYSAQRIRAAAYDVALTMLNEELMHISNPSDPDVVMLVTRDRQLAMNGPIIRLKGMSLLKNGDLRVLNPWNEALIDQTFGEYAEHIRVEISEKLRKGPAFKIPPAELLEIIKEYESRLNIPQPALSSLKF